MSGLNLRLQAAPSAAPLRKATSVSDLRDAGRQARARGGRQGGPVFRSARAPHRFEQVRNGQLFPCMPAYRAAPYSLAFCSRAGLAAASPSSLAQPYSAPTNGAPIYEQMSCMERMALMPPES